MPQKSLNLNLGHSFFIRRFKVDEERTVLNQHCWWSVDIQIGIRDRLWERPSIERYRLDNIESIDSGKKGKKIEQSAFVKVKMLSLSLFAIRKRMLVDFWFSLSVCSTHTVQCVRYQKFTQIKWARGLTPLNATQTSKNNLNSSDDLHAWLLHTVGTTHCQQASRYRAN